MTYSSTNYMLALSCLTKPWKGDLHVTGWIGLSKRTFQHLSLAPSLLSHDSIRICPSRYPVLFVVMTLTTPRRHMRRWCASANPPFLYCAARIVKVTYHLLLLPPACTLSGIEPVHQYSIPRFVSRKEGRAYLWHVWQLSIELNAWFIRGPSSQIRFPGGSIWILLSTCLKFRLMD